MKEQEDEHELSIISPKEWEEMYENYKIVGEMKCRALECKTKLQLLPICKEYYNYVYDDIIKCRSAGKMFYAYGLPFERFFTPIEESAWYYIRCAGLPLLPEYPVMNFFIDFADPYLKIGVECDGKDWHDPEKDAKRDATLKKLGWHIYRITGTQLTRQITEEAEQKITDEWDENEGDCNYSYDAFSAYRSATLERRFDYSKKYASAIFEYIARRHYNTYTNYR